jgi:hypothetical protein
MEGPGGLKQYPVPWRDVLSLTPTIGRGGRHDLIAFTRGCVAKLDQPPLVEGLEQLPASPRFVLAANHFQRKGLWILHPASIVTNALQRHYGLDNPPVRWVVTANWPPLKLGPWRMPSPGDWLLPRVAHALHAYPVSFAGEDPSLTARTYRALLSEARTLARPLGLFPEGVAGTALAEAPPLPGVERLLVLLARQGIPVVPCRFSEYGGLLRARFGPLIPAAEIESAAAEAALCVMKAIRTSG